MILLTLLGIGTDHDFLLRLLRHAIAGLAPQHAVQSGRRPAFGGAALGLAIAVPMVKQKLPWRDRARRERREGRDRAQARPAEVAANSVDPETVSSFTAVHLVRDGPQYAPQKGKVRATLAMDATARPKAFQVTPVEPATEQSGWMLFSREGENLKIAFYDNLNGRPESFEPRDPRVRT